VAPYGVYDPAANEAGVSVGITGDTAEFAMRPIRTWRERMSLPRDPDMRELTITADWGGSNGARVRQGKVWLEKFADETSLTVNVRHYPPGGKDGPASVAFMINATVCRLNGWWRWNTCIVGAIGMAMRTPRT